MRTHLRRILGFTTVLLAFGTEGTGCGTPEIGLDIVVPRDIVESTVWFEIGAFKDARCAAVVPMLPNGIPEGATARVAFERSGASPPRLGEIPNGSYAFAAVARDEECGVLAVGCVEKDVDDVDRVSITLSPTDEPTGMCPEGASCQAAKCVPALDNSDPSIGAGCSLELLGAGPLATPLGGAGSLISAPAIAATSAGFVIGYREIDPHGAGARITILPIDFGGGALTPLRPALPDPCSSSDETDGVGLVVTGDDAMMALAKAPCGGKAPELQLLNFRAAPELVLPDRGAFLVSASPAGVRVTLGAARAAAARPAGSLVVFAEGGTARIANMNPSNGIVGPNGTFGGTQGITDAWVAATDRVLALLAAGKGGTSGADDDAGAPPDPNESTLRLHMLPADTKVDTINAASATPITFPGEWGSIAASQGRVIVMSDGSGPGRSVTYRAFDLDRNTPSDMSGFSVEGGGKVTAGDVVIRRDRAYFASLKEGAVALHVFANATTTLTPLSNVLFSREPRISAINTVRDGRVSVAATETRVAVVWTTAKVLGPNDGTGGYAVFGCSD